MSRSRVIASDLLEDGWLPPKAACNALGITDAELARRVRTKEIRRREVAPGTGLFLYEVRR